jgi:aryl-alcohol dehydrogenase-like predicted oxidoreductase
MQKRRIGNSVLEVAPLAFGSNVFGWTVKESMAFRLLDEFTGNGFNLIDTADIYSKWGEGNKGGESETIIGKWLKQKGGRDKVIIATKVGMEMSQTEKGLSKAYILKEVEASLKRLQTDYIDLYQSHQDDFNTPVEETLEAYNILVKQGKVRVIGASNFTAERLQQSLDISKKNNFPSYQCLQPLYNLHSRQDYESKLEQFCLKNKLGVIPYYSLASGFLSGKYKSGDDSSKSPRGGGVIKKYLDERGKKILEALEETANHYSVGMATIAISWLAARESITAPIASATNPEQLKELMKSAEIKPDSVFMERLNNASSY